MTGDIDVIDEKEWAAMSGVVVDETVPKVSKNGDGTVTLTLAHPVSLLLRKGNEEKTETVSTLKFRRVTGGDIRALGNIKKEGDMIADLFCRLTGIAPVVFDRLDAEDIAEGAEIIEDFLPQSLRASIGVAT